MFFLTDKHCDGSNITDAYPTVQLSLLEKVYKQDPRERQHVKDKMEAFIQFKLVIVLKTKQEAAREELRFINQSWNRRFGKLSYAQIQFQRQNFAVVL